MFILSAADIRRWDEYTMENEPISSIDLMERAATSCTEWLMQNGYERRSFSILCGKGNNGGDGLAIARILSLAGNEVVVYILEFGHLGTADFQLNLERAHATNLELKFIPAESLLPTIPQHDVIIDAVLGTGLNRPAEGLTAALIGHINKSGNEIISIDIPSGLSADQSSRGNTAITATHTLSFQCFKKAFLVAENQEHIGQLHILDIGLHAGFEKQMRDPILAVDLAVAQKIYRPRKPFSHKGTFGHSLLIGGSYSKFGAIVLAAKACLRAGTGLLTVHAPAKAYTILQTAVPEAMTRIDVQDHHISKMLEDIDNYDAVGIGPGIGQDANTARALDNFLSDYRHPAVYDADALNILANNKDWLNRLQQHSILTPHPKEFERLFGETENDFRKIELAAEQASTLRVIIVLKGRYTCIALPSGKTYFNFSGNPGLATGGTGDVLTGIITALLAQKYSPEDAALLGVFLHGLSADMAAQELSEESLTASDVCEYLGQAFKKLNRR